MGTTGAGSAVSIRTSLRRLVSPDEVAALGPQQLMTHETLSVGDIQRLVRDGGSWRLAFDTADPARDGDVLTGRATFVLGAHALAVLVPR